MKWERPRDVTFRLPLEKEDEVIIRHAGPDKEKNVPRIRKTWSYFYNTAFLWVDLTLNIVVLLLLDFLVDTTVSLCSTHHHCRCIHNEGKVKVNCSNLGLVASPIFSRNVSEVDLSHNKIVYFPDFHYLPKLSRLDLSYNRLDGFKCANSTNNALGLTSLTFLNVSHNTIPLNKEVYFDKLFRGMKKLRVLDVSRNAGFDILEYPDVAFGHLVALQELRIDIKGDKPLGKGFLNLKNLTVLNFSIVGGTDHCVSISKGFLQNVPYLESLHITNCNLRVIEVGTLSTLTHLKALDISHNKQLGWCGFRNVTQDLPHTEIETFTANHLHDMTSEFGSLLFSSDILPLKNTNLRKLYINQNILQSLEFDIFRYLPKSLETLEANENRISFSFQFSIFYERINIHLQHLVNLKSASVSHTTNTGDQVLFYPSDLPLIAKCFYSRLKFANIMTLPCEVVSNKYYGDNHSTYDNDDAHRIPDIYNSRQSNVSQNQSGPVVAFPNAEKYVDHRQQHYKGISWKTTIPVPPHLKQLTAVGIMGDMSFLEIGPITINFTSDTIELLNISNNGLRHLNASFGNVSNVQVLDLSHNQCVNISSNSFHGFFKLKKLFLNDNELDDFFRSEDSCHSFSRMSKLQHLDISRNKMTYLYGCVLQSMSKLQVINLSYNRLTNWNVPITHMSNLTLINLAYNVIQYLDTDAMSLLKDSSSDGLEIDLSGNPFHCLCDSLSFFQWILTTTDIHIDRHECILLEGSLKVSIRDAVTKLNHDCPNNLSVYLILSCCLTLVLTLIITVLIYKHKWRIRYWYYVAKTDKTRAGGYQRLHDDYKFDAFISYCETEGDFIRNELLHTLETEHNLKLCIHERDFIPGCNIAENIVNAIHNSRKVICIITESFIKSTWCMYELNISVTESVVSRDGSDIILLMFMNYKPNKKTPKVIMNACNNDTYIDVPPPLENRTTFWRRTIAGLSI